MFDVGFWELMILFTLALLVLGPERLPRVTNTIGRWVGRARAMASNLKDQIEEEVSLKELEKLHGMNDPIDLDALSGAAKKKDPPDASAADTDDDPQEDNPQEEESSEDPEESPKSNEPA